MLRVQGLSFRYPQSDLFSDWNICIAPGVTLVQGGDGSGKTTLLRLLAGELMAQGGRLQIKGIDLAKQPDAYHQQLFWIDPRSSAFDQTTPLDFLGGLGSRYAAFDRSLAIDLLDGLSLTEHQDKPMYMLSTGSKRKVWLVGAFACGASLMLLDEPFAALDRASIGFVTELLKEAAHHTQRAWVMTNYRPPDGVALAAVIDLEA